jgi:hypothetical protein
MIAFLKDGMRVLRRASNCAGVAAIAAGAKSEASSLHPFSKTRVFPADRKPTSRIAVAGAGGIG